QAEKGFRVRDVLQGPGKIKLDQHLAILRELENQKELLEAEISRQSAAFRSQFAPITLEEIQKHIPPDACLVEFAVYRPYDAKTGKFRAPRYMAYLISGSGSGVNPGQTHQSKLQQLAPNPKEKNQRDKVETPEPVQWVDLGDAAPIEAAVSVFRQTVRNRLSENRIIGLNQSSKTQFLRVKEAGRTLDQLIFQPVRKLLGKTRRVLLSPDGVLNLIPFDALVDEKGRYLVETYEFSYLTSGRDLLRFPTSISSQQPPIVIANPDYASGAGPHLLGKQYSPLSRLAGTVAEAEQLKAIFPDALVFLDSQSTESVLTQANRPEFLHIGTHGYFLADVLQSVAGTLETSRLLGRSEDMSPEDLDLLRQANPLLRSYLFFAGANQPTDESGNDGIVTALEVTGLNLWGTKLVVLSACDTGLGEVKNGDGVYGLRRALVVEHR
ncbi:MAG TPA: CHAT domain-containing protein, partial [Acidobacteriota bacterium]|nr:CHAT domain-containing protein [Acidobacteriota bacterium]